MEISIIATWFANISSSFSVERYRNYLYISLEDSIMENKYPKLYLISDDISKIIDTVKEQENVIFAGLYFGFIKKGKFYISLEGAEFLYKHKIISNFKKLHINNKGEKSILYGNDISKNMIVESPTVLKKDDFLVIFNMLNEIIALGRSAIDKEDIQILEPNKIIAINLVDKGSYLRKRQ
ncbi:MAG: hypothetical protein ACFFB0_19975 [Promethearchaeota archaeon]